MAKYNLDGSKVPAFKSAKVDGVTLSSHAITRWLDRTPSWSVSPEEAFKTSQQCHEKMNIWAHSSNNVPIPTEVRYFLELDTNPGNDTYIYEVLFIRCNETVVTIYPRSFIDDEDANQYLDNLRDSWLEPAPRNR